MDLPSAIALLLAAVCAALSVVGLMGAFSDALDVLNHFTPITLVISLAALGANIGAGAHVPGVALGGIAVCACLALMIPELVAARWRRGSEGSGPRLKIVQFNLWAGSRDLEASLAWIRSEDADIVVLQETVGPCRRAPEALARLYPYRSPSAGSPSGAVILSKIAPTDVGLFTPTAAGRRSAAAWARFGEAETGFTVAGVHLRWPIPAGPQQAQLARLAEALAPFEAGSLILTGDFNSAPWSFTLRRFDRRVGLTRRTRALATWPTRRFALPFPFLAIDHVYAGSDWKTVSVRRGPRLGSDHFPVVAVLERPGEATIPVGKGDARTTTSPARRGASGGGAEGEDLAGIARGFAPGEGVDVFHARGDLAPDGVLAVEKTGVGKADEELAVGGIGIGGAGHRADAADMRSLGEFGFQVRLARSARAAAGRIAALGHEARDHPVEGRAVVEALGGQLLDPGDMTRREIGAKTDGHLAGG